MLIQKGYKFTIEECFKINEYLVDKTPCLFQKEITLAPKDVIDVFFELKDSKATLSGLSKTGKVLFKKSFRLNNPKEIKDILSLYEITFIHNLENYILTMNLIYDYDTTYFTSMGEFLVSHLDCLKHRKEKGEENLLLEYLAFYDLKNTATVLYSSYILELLRDTPLFLEATDIFTTNLIWAGYELYKINQNFREEEDVKEHLEVLEDSSAKYIHNVAYIMVGLFPIELDRKNVFHKLVTSRVNEELVYKVFSEVLINLNDEKYLKFTS